MHREVGSFTFYKFTCSLGSDKTLQMIFKYVKVSFKAAYEQCVAEADTRLRDCLNIDKEEPLPVYTDVRITYLKK